MIKKVKSIPDVMEMLSEDSTLEQKMKNDPLGTLRELYNPWQDKWIFRAVIVILGTALVASLGVVAWITLSEPVSLVTTGENGEQTTVTQLREVNQIFVMVASAAIGAIAGLLSRSPDS